MPTSASAALQERRYLEFHGDRIAHPIAIYAQSRGPDTVQIRHEDMTARASIRPDRARLGLVRSRSKERNNMAAVCTQSVDTVALGYAKVSLLGVVQGITELLPISSTAHIRVLPALLGWQDPGSAFSAAMQLAALAAVVFSRSDSWSRRSRRSLPSGA